MRGEYIKEMQIAPTQEELPPRARRIQGATLADPRVEGTTSACAENTRDRAMPLSPLLNYLRMRGEYKGHRIKPFTGEELPPHARRIHIFFPVGGPGVGTTSACAENTFRM